MIVVERENTWERSAWWCIGMAERPFFGEKSPIFIVGCGRSGSTLLAAMLDAHPEIDIPRTEALYSIYGSFVPVPTGTANLPDRRWRNLLRMFVTDAGVRAWEYPPTTADIDTKVPIQNFSAAYRLLHEHHARKAGKSEWGAKMIGGEFFVDRLLGDHPNARFVRCVRDGRAVALSLTENDFGPTTLTGGAHHWVSSMQAWDVAKTRGSDERLYSLRYEDLVTDTEESLRNLFEFLKIPWHKDCMKYYESDFAQTRSRDPGHTNLARRPDIARLTRVFDVLSSAELGQIEAIAGDYLNLNGYSLVSEHHEYASVHESRMKRVLHSVRYILQHLLTKDRVRRASFVQRHYRRLLYSIRPI